MIDESKNVQTTPPPPRTYCKCRRPLSYCNTNCRMPQHWKFYPAPLHHPTPPPPHPHPRTYCKCRRPLSYCNTNCRMPRHWKFYPAPSHHPTTPILHTLWPLIITLVAPHNNPLDGSNDGSQIMFLWGNMANYIIIIPAK